MKYVLFHDLEMMGLVCQLRHQLRLDAERIDHAVYTKQSSTYDTYCV